MELPVVTSGRRGEEDEAVRDFVVWLPAWPCLPWGQALMDSSHLSALEFLTSGALVLVAFQGFIVEMASPKIRMPRGHTALEVCSPHPGAGVAIEV